MKANNPFRRRIARPLFYIGVLCLIAAGVLTFLAYPVYPGLLLGLGILAFGLNAMLGGDLIVGRPARQFNAKGNVVRGKATIQAQLCDLAVGDGPTDRVAIIRSGPLGTPDFQIQDGVAYLSVTQPKLLKNITEWQAGLASNILWDLDLSSSLGDMTINLTELRVEFAEIRTKSGHVTVLLPNRGAPTVEIRAGIGEVEVVVPPEAGARITVTHGELVNVRVENDRLQPSGIDSYITAGFERAPTQLEVSITTRAGDIILAD